MRMKITFPTETSYGNSLGLLRRSLKPYIHIEIRKRPEGAYLSGPSKSVAVVPFLLPPEFSIAEWNLDDTNSERPENYVWLATS
jgi:hypothetical protein